MGLDKLKVRSSGPRPNRRCTRKVSLSVNHLGASRGREEEYSRSEERALLNVG